MNIKICGLNFSYNNIPTLQNIDLEIVAGNILAIVGQNGSGKTTLLRAISGLIKPTKGAVFLDLNNLAKMSYKEIAQYIATIEQEIRVAFDFTVEQIIELGRTPHRKIFGLSNTPEDRNIIEKAMIQTDTRQFANRSLFTLSSGERQRVWLAMALAQEPQVLLLDEPTSHIDIHYQIEILDIIQNLANQQHLTIIMATHDLNLAAYYANYIALLKKGQLVSVGTPEQVLTKEAIDNTFQTDVSIIQIPGKDGVSMIIPSKIKNRKREVNPIS